MTIILLSILVISSFLYFKKPKHNRDWRPEQSKLPKVKIEGREVSIRNIRNCLYRSERDLDLSYYDKVFNLDDLKSIDLVVQPFKKIPFIAHVFLSFGFKDDKYISVSAEARRKEKSIIELNNFFRRISAPLIILFGFFRSFELIYIIADDADIMRLRPLHHKDKVYIYPLKFKKEKIEKIFLDIMYRINVIEKKPEFYNTLLNSCVNNTLKHLKTGGDIKIPKSWRVFFPAKIDKLIYDIGIMRTRLSFEKIRETFLINKKAEKYQNENNYSSKIRS